jgi:RNA polymerase sigma factor (sigma-70 family)
MPTREPELPPPGFPEDLLPQFHSVLRGLIHNEDDRNDIIHDTFAKAIPRGLLVEEKTSFLIKMAVNIAIDRIRSAQRHRRILLALSERGYFRESIEPEDVDHRLDRDDLILRVLEAMERLHPGTRKCIEDHFLRGKTIRAMAEEMDIVGRNVERKLKRALHRLRGLLDAT